MTVRKYVSLKEAAKVLHVSRTTLYRLVRLRRIPYIRIGWQFRVPLDDVLRSAGGSTNEQPDEPNNP